MTVIHEQSHVNLCITRYTITADTKSNYKEREKVNYELKYDKLIYFFSVIIHIICITQHSIWRYDDVILHIKFPGQKLHCIISKFIIFAIYFPLVTEYNKFNYLSNRFVATDTV